MLAATMTPAWADQNPSQGDTRPPIILTRGNSQGHIQRPKAPDRQVITCSYDGETLILNFVYSEGMGILSIKDEEGNEYIYDVDSSSLLIKVPVGNLKGMIHVQLDTEDGRFFEGIFE